MTGQIKAAKMLQLTGKRIIEAILNLHNQKFKSDNFAMCGLCTTIHEKTDYQRLDTVRVLHRLALQRLHAQQLANLELQWTDKSDW